MSIWTDFERERAGARLKALATAITPPNAETDEQIRARTRAILDRISRHDRHFGIENRTEAETLRALGYSPTRAQSQKKESSDDDDKSDDSAGVQGASGVDADGLADLKNRSGGGP